MLAAAVDPRHLSPAAIDEVRAQFDLHANRHAVIDDFLLPAHLAPLRELVSGPDGFTENLKVSPHGTSVAHLPETARRARVDRALFDSVPEADRFIAQEIYGGAAEGSSDSRPQRTDAVLRKVLRSSPMHALLGAMSGLALEETLAINLKRHGKGHYLRRHSDATGGRRLCGVLYLHEHWRREYGGRFLLHRDTGAPFAIDPLPNRLVLFDVTVRNDHEIEDLGSVPKGWWRANYSVWFR